MYFSKLEAALRSWSRSQSQIRKRSHYFSYGRKSRIYFLSWSRSHNCTIMMRHCNSERRSSTYMNICLIVLSGSLLFIADCLSAIRLLILSISLLVHSWPSVCHLSNCLVRLSACLLLAICLLFA
jgi:hypothetical protein